LDPVCLFGHEPDDERADNDPGCSSPPSALALSVKYHISLYCRWSGCCIEPARKRVGQQVKFGAMVCICSNDANLTFVRKDDVRLETG
jgi:hypothetical protein